MTREAFVFKWFWYAMAVLPVWLAEDLIFSRFPLFGVSPMLLPLAVVAVAVLEGPVAGAGFGLGVGLLWSASLGGPGPLAVAGLALAGAAAGGLAQYILKQTYAGCLLCSAGLLALLDLGRILRRLMDGTAGLGAMLAVAIPEILVSLVFVAPVYLLFRKVWSKVGGTKLM